MVKELFKNKRLTSRKLLKRELVKQEILDAAREILFTEGTKSLTIEAISKHIGLTKPAIYYYFSSKQEIIQKIITNLIIDEYGILYKSVKKANSGAEALENLIRSFCEYYLDNKLPQFRLIYHYMQIFGKAETLKDKDVFMKEINPLSQNLYSLIEEKLKKDQNAGKISLALNLRRLGVSANMAAIGLVTMIGLTGAAEDPLIHKNNELIDEMCLSFRLASGGNLG